MDEYLQTVFRHSSAAITKGTSLSIKTRTQSQFVATPEAEKEMDELFQTVFINNKLAMSGLIIIKKPNI